MLAPEGVLVPFAGVAGQLLMADSTTASMALFEAREVHVTPLPTMDSTRPLAHVEVTDRPAVMLGAWDTAVAACTLHGSVLMAHDLIGVGGWCLDTACEYARTREQFGRAIGGYQAISHLLADAFVELELARSHAYHAAWAVAASDDVAALAASQAKAAASAAAVMCAEASLQVHGGIGFTWEHDLHLYLKRARSGAAAFGGVSTHLRHIADRCAPSAGAA